MLSIQRTDIPATKSLGFIFLTRSGEVSIMALKTKTLPEPKGVMGELIDQFYVTLHALFDRIHQQNGSASDHSSLSEVKELLEKKPRTWRTAYHVEQLLIPYYSDQELEVELRRRLVDAQKLLAKSVYGAYEQAKGSLDSEQDPMNLSLEPSEAWGN